METISWEDRDGARWIMLEGEIDAHAWLEIQERFRHTVAEGEGDVVVLLNGVTFLSSHAVGMLVEAQKRLASRGRRLRLSGLSFPVRRALDMMKLGDHFEIV